ncbi:MAG: cupin domain-containing protein [Gammaproteobacteria bacterium]|nr:cupin domain-containing protein [Gammaproteobacteria bacterium]
MTTAIPTTYLDNNRLRVTEWRFRNRGDNTGWHRHEYDYLVVPLFNGVLEIETADGRTEATLQHGVPYFRQAGVEHDVINGNDFECAFVEVELMESP